MTIRVKSKNTHQDVFSVITTAVEQTRLSGLCEILRCVTEATDAYGCILWEVAPGAELEKAPPQGLLFVLAHWFSDDQSYALHDLPLNSATGNAVLSQKTVNISDISKDDRVYIADPFLHRHNIRVLCSVPVKFLDGARGALNIYRNQPVIFSSQDVSHAEELAALLPALYQVIRDKVSQALLSKVDEELYRAERRGSATISLEDIKNVIRVVCQLVSQTFQCVETSVFLASHAGQSDQYQLAATTWPAEFRKKTYSKDEDGLTSWVLRSAKSIKILDLAHFQRDAQGIRREYPQLSWADSLGVASAIRGFRNLKEEEPLPPLSFMAAPVIIGAEVGGVIRCCAATVAPYYFASREVSLLQLVAARLGQYWSGWLRQCEMEEENRCWRALVDSIAEMNRFVHHELTSQMPDESKIFREGLRIAQSVIPSGEISDVRLLDKNTNELYFAVTYGTAWSEGGKAEIEQRRRKRFPVFEKPASSAGAHVFQTGEVYPIADVTKDPYYSETFPNTRRMLIAPISSESEFFGVLDIRGTGPGSFPPHAASIAYLLGQQLGLYQYLAFNIRALLHTQAELNENIKRQNEDTEKQIQVFQDLKHQLQTPVIQAHARIQGSLAGDLDLRRPQGDLLAIRGLCGKAKRVCMNVGFFADLSKDGSVRVNPLPLTYDNLIKMLIEAATDAQLLVDPARPVRFTVDRRSFDPLVRNRVKADVALIEQAISNILDNAAKYSWPKTFVRIYGGITGGGRFHVSVMNKGLKLYPEDVNRCAERGWRSEPAKWTTGEGSGIGLWIVKHIMKAHSGELIIMPTADDGFTDVKLVFPAEQIQP